MADANEPARVLAVWCPGWPEDAGGAGARAFGDVITVVEGFCPEVEILRPGLCLLAARGPARYFGGEDALARKIADAVTAHGVVCHTGVAAGQFAAGLAARAVRPDGTGVVVPPGGARQFLAPYPVHVLAAPALAGQLARLGIRTLRDLAALPARDVASRFGAEGTAVQRVARGQEARRLAAGPPQADLSARLEFDPPVHAEPAVFAAKGLAEQMLAGLASRGLSCVRVRVEVTGTDGRESSRLWRHDGLLSALAVAQRVRWQLDGWSPGAAAEDGPDESVCGIAMLRLVPDHLVPDEGRQLGLWGDDLISGRVERAAVRLQAMLGHESVAHPVLAGGRGPGERVMLVPFGDIRDARHPADRPWPARIPPPAPATVYPVPRPARVIDAAGMPVTVTGRAAVSASPDALAVGDSPWRAITAWAGPWPVTERWWDEQNATRRARFQLVTDDGIAWLAAVELGRWQIEARYD
ncbi:MAG: DNA polymerase Y family protein [Streptosporangiaceae bacterium]